MADQTPVGMNAGHGGETHQKADGDHPVLHTNQGMPISDNQNQLKQTNVGRCCSRTMSTARR